MRKKGIATVFALILGLGGFLAVSTEKAPAEEPATDTPAAESPSIGPEVEAEDKPAEAGSKGGRDVTQLSDAYVFLAWWWLVTIVLLYALRQKMREADALEHMGFHSSSRKE